MTQSSPASPHQAKPHLVFDRKQVRLHRERAARHYDEYAFLKQRAAQDIVDRFQVVPRPFENILDLGSHSGIVEHALRQEPDVSARIKHIFNSDLSTIFSRQNKPLSIISDEELLPFKAHSFDAIISSLTLHWVNDLPGTLIQIRQALKPDGLFFGQLFGGSTLNELRSCLLEAEAEIKGGAVMRISPFTDLQDLSALLQRTGFIMPVADTETVTVRYSSALKLLQDLRGMGETAAFYHAPDSPKPPKLTRAVLFRAMELYHQKYADDDGKVRASFEIITASGWSPGPDQPQPLKPGSATASLADALSGSHEKS